VDAFSTPEMRESRDAVLTELRRRMEELRPVLEEVKRLEEYMEIIEIAERQIEKINKPIPYEDIVRWFKRTYAPTDVFHYKDMRIAFDRSNEWVRERAEYLRKDGYLEGYGNGLWRRPAIDENRSITVHPGTHTPERPAVG